MHQRSAAGVAALPPAGAVAAAPSPEAALLPLRAAALVPSLAAWAAPLRGNCTPVSVRLSRLGSEVVSVRPAGAGGQKWRSDGRSRLMRPRDAPAAAVCCAAHTVSTSKRRPHEHSSGCRVAAVASTPEAPLRARSRGAVVFSGCPSLYNNHWLLSGTNSSCSPLMLTAWTASRLLPTVKACQ